MSAGVQNTPTGETIEDVVAKYKRQYHIYRSTNNHLLLDLDDEAAVHTYARNAPDVQDQWGPWAKIESWKSKSGKGTHVFVTLSKPLPAPVRYGLQLWLGSDPVREILSLKRLKDGETEPSILFRPKTT